MILWIHNCVDECSQWPSETSVWKKLVVAGGADATDMVIETQVKRDVDTKQTNMAAGNGSVGF